MAENFQNFYVTKLREACDAVATTIYVDTVPAITEGTLVIEYANSTKHEIIHFTGVSGYGLTGCTRGMEGTTAQSHSAGVDVRQNLTAGMIDKIINGVITTENIADGAVTADKIDFTTFGAFSRYIDGSQTITAWQETAIQVDNKDFNDYGCTYNSTTHKITITQGGIWVFSAQAGVVGTGESEFGGIGIKLNGTPITSTRYRGNASFPAVGATTCILKVSNGDVIEAAVGGSKGVTNSSRTYSNFSGACIQAF